MIDENQAKELEEYQSLIEVNARTTVFVLALLYPQPLVKSSEQSVNKKLKNESISLSCE